MRLPDGTILYDTDEDGVRHAYDPVKAHAYYLRTRKLKGRKKGSGQPDAAGRPRRGPDPAVRARKRRELAARIASLEDKLQKLEALIRKRETEEKQKAKKAAAKKNKATKEAAKPDTAAEKAKKAREAKQYRAKNRQKLKTAAKKDGGGSSKAGSGDKKTAKPSIQSTKDLKKLATTVRGQIATAKARLRSL